MVEFLACCPSEFIPETSTLILFWISSLPASTINFRLVNPYNCMSKFLKINQCLSLFLSIGTHTFGRILTNATNKPSFQERFVLFWCEKNGSIGWPRWKWPWTVWPVEANLCLNGSNTPPLEPGQIFLLSDSQVSQMTLTAWGAPLHHGPPLSHDWWPGILPALSDWPRLPP